MSVFLRLLVISASWLLSELRWTTVEAARSQYTCPRFEASNDIQFLHRADGYPLVNEDTFQKLARSNSEKAARSLEDELVRLQRTVADIRKEMDHHAARRPSWDTSLVHSPAVGDARELLFAVRQMQVKPKTSFVELASLTRKRDEPVALALSSILVVACSRDGLLEARSLGGPPNSVILQTSHTAEVLSMSVFPKGDDVSILTTDEDGIALLHVVSARRSESPPTSRNTTISNASTAKDISITPLILSLESAGTFRVSLGGASRHNCVITATVKGERVVMVGGSDGFLS